MNRESDHYHHHAAPDYNRAFALGVSLNVVFVLIEVFFGVVADSLALITDAGHNLSDVMGLLLAWGASFLAGKQPSKRRTYGYSRATILASMFSGLLLLAAVVLICWEAVQRFFEPAQPVGPTIMVVAGIGVVINSVTAWLFVSGKDHDLNIRGAYLHMAADAMVSVGVVVSGFVIWKFGLKWFDPLSSLLIAMVIFWSTWGLLRDSLNLAIDAVPRGIDPAEIRAWLSTQAGVAAMHDLHIWPVSTTETALTAHLVMPEPPTDDKFLQELAFHLQQEFGIAHATFQIERGNVSQPCKQSEGCAE
ncbi:MAG: cation diffusion facilitator family transporter [Gammaproteobacteria bacterium]|nr:cation diffusion facilitator family transporter [Gammaproteobacteria bacterium]NNL00339.1 cation transporter [Xanthomonadales bacterium]